MAAFVAAARWGASHIGFSSGTMTSNKRGEATVVVW